MAHDEQLDRNEAKNCQPGGPLPSTVRTLSRRGRNQNDKTHRQEENHPVEHKRKDEEQQLRSLDLMGAKSDWEQRKKALHCLPRLVQRSPRNRSCEPFRGIKGKEETSKRKPRSKQSEISVQTR
ncbi:MAG: hypothetical protein J2P36_14175 [Ktedonobacteraceae bacterium]|nr:hypothetical protein [Ktedonobacteraceae bacterium]